MEASAYQPTCLKFHSQLLWGFLSHTPTRTGCYIKYRLLLSILAASGFPAIILRIPDTNIPWRIEEKELAMNFWSMDTGQACPRC